MLPAPPPTAERYSSDDLDEIRELLRPYGEQHCREQRGSGALGWEMAVCPGRQAAVGWIRSDLAQVIRATVKAPVLHFSERRRQDYRVGGRTLSVLPERAVLVRPGEPYEACLEPGLCLGWRLDAAALELELEARFRDEERAGWGSMEISLVGGRRGALGQIVRSFVDQTTSADSERRATALEAVEGQLLDWVATLIHERSPGNRGVDGGLRRVQRVEEWVDEHLAESITLGRLCEVARVGARTLQTSFQRWRGQTPLEFVRERRLAVARMRLMAAEQDLSVTEVALGCGFHHLGRFSVLYRQKFGVSPSETLRPS